MRARLRWVVAGLLGAAVLGGVLLWALWPKPVPLPPLDLTGAEPEVRKQIEEARDAVLKKPSSARNWGTLGKVLLANGYDNEAMAVFEQATRLDPAEPRWPYLRARRLLLTDRVKGRELLEHAVRLADAADPDNVACKLLLVEALGEQGDTERAIALADEALARAPDDPRAHYLLGTLYLQRDELEKSLSHFLRASGSPLTRKRACLQLAAVSLRTGNRAASEQFLRQAQELPNDPLPIDPYVAEYQDLTAGRQAKFLRAEELESQNRLLESAGLLQEVAGAAPDVRSGVALGTALIKLGNNAGAEKVLREAMARAESASPAGYYALAVAQFNQAEALREQGQSGPAEEKYREAEQSARVTLAGKPDHANAHLFLGRALLRLGRRDEAMAEFRKAIACRPELAGPHLSLGEALAESGQKAEARQELQQAVTLAASYDPAGPAARAALARLDKP